MSYASHKKKSARKRSKQQMRTSLKQLHARSAMARRMREVEKAEARVKEQEWAISTPFMWLWQLLMLLNRIAPIGPFADIAHRLFRWNLPTAWEFRGWKYMGTSVRIKSVPKDSLEQENTDTSTPR